MSRPIVVLCVADLQHIVPHFEKDMLDNPKYKGDMRALLHNLGFDTDFGIEYQQLEAMSRTKFCGVVKTDRIVGCERCDTLWLQSGNSSDMAKEWTGDITMTKELSKMKRGNREPKQQKESEE